MKKPLPQEVWIYDNNVERRYIIIARGSMKVLNSEWIDSIIYQCALDGRIYTRDLVTFMQKFSFLRGIAA